MKKIFVCLLTLSLFACAFCFTAKAEEKVNFSDVPSDAWYKESVEEAVVSGLMNGVSDTQFAPDGSTTRAQLITILWRMEGQPASDAVVPFNDLDQDWYKDAVKWAYGNQIVTGTSPTTFSPNANLSREALITVLYRYLDGISPNDALQGSIEWNENVQDEDRVSNWAKKAINWACSNNIMDISAASDGLLYLNPQNDCTRAEFAVIIVRFDNKYYDVLYADDPKEDDFYFNIPRVTSSGYSVTSFGSHGVSDVLQLSHPEEWSFKQNDDASFSITRDNKTIGCVLRGEGNADSWKCVSKKQKADANYVNTEYIEKKGSGRVLQFRYRFVFEPTNSTSDKTTVILDCDQINPSIEIWLRNLSKIKLLDTTDIVNNRKLTSLRDAKLLILGNSFIGTSKVGDILIEMVKNNGKNCNVTWWSRGYASVNTYINDASIMSDIRQGVYDAVFICGFYSNPEVANLGILKAACDESNTKLVLFPAHNENRSVIQMALETYPELAIMDWKNEIDMLISTGINKWNFCINDEHLHSNTLAGYIGAHMIYCAIYDKVPSVGVSMVSLDYVKSVTRDYHKTGIIKFEEVQNLYYFN